MKKSKRLSKAWSMRHLPEELWPEILCRLPVKSLLRFRSVSKAWLSLIKDPDFCRIHLKNFKNNNDENHILVVESSQQNCVVRCSDTFEAATETLLSLGHIYDQKGWQLVCSIDGLVLLKKYFRDGDSMLNYLRVWNPSIRKVHDISLTKMELSSDSFFDLADIGLGYDPMIKDYKTLLHSVAIYTLGAGSWKTIQLKGIGFSDWRWELPFRDLETASLQGHVYFIARDWVHCCSELISIDLSNEVFRCTSLPIGTFRGTYSLALADGGRSLAVFNFQYCSNMWVLESPRYESEPACWNKRYSLDLMPPKFLYLKKNDDILIWWDMKETSFFTLATGRKLELKWDLVSSYNLETKTEKILMRKRHNKYNVYSVSGYVESLILL